MTTFDPTLCSRLISEAGEDAAMLKAFREFGDSQLIRTKHGTYGTCAVVKALERERDLVTQLEAAIAEVRSLRGAEFARIHAEELP